MNTFRAKNIKRESLGTKLRQARERKNIDIQSASIECKIPEKYLEYLESEDWKALPGEIYVKNFLKKYCSFLGIHFGICFQQYKKQFYKVSLRKTAQNRGSFINRIIKSITPHKIRLFLFIFVLISVIGYIVYATSTYTRPPKLEILSPEQNYSTSENVIIIKGITEPEATITVNGEGFPIESTGNFYIEAKLKYGLNMFEIISQRKHGRQHKENVVVFKKKD
jgi:cytoskeletal protein RodZ